MTGQAKAGVALGILAGLLVGAVVGGALRVSAGVIAENAQRRAWPLIPITIAKRDLPTGQVLSMDDIDQKSIPERLATEALVTPQDAAYVINQKLQAPMVEGQPLEWAFFDSPSPAQREPIARAACEAAITARLGPAKPETVEQIRIRITQEAR